MTRLSLSWDDARLFLVIAEQGSVSKGAAVLGVGQPTLSRRLALLEHQLGGPLFRRSAQGVSMTSMGERMLPAARKMADWAGELERAAERGAGGPSGVVRITASPYVSFDFVAPFAGWLAQKHPGLQLEVLSSVQLLDLGRGEADLALRNRASVSSELRVLKTLTLDTRIYVSRSLRSRLGRKPAVTDLPWIAWAPPFDSVTPNPQLAAMVPNFRPVFTADNFLVMLAAAEAGVGAMVLSDFRHRFARETTLVPLELDLGAYSTSHWHLVAVKSALDVPRVRLVADLLMKDLR